MFKKETRYTTVCLSCWTATKVGAKKKENGKEKERNEVKDLDIKIKLMK